MPWNNRRYAHSDRHIGFFIVGSMSNFLSANAVMNFLGDAPGTLGIGIGQNDGKFLTAVASDQVGRALRAAEQGAGDANKTAIACRMPKGVVIPLEMVEVAQDERKRTAGLWPGAAIRRSNARQIGGD